MQKRLFISILFLCFLLLPSVCMAAAGEEIFNQLADKAQTIGTGLRDSGFIIAALGLIVFSFMAIFNKISWKTLAYIMLSTFILTAMFAVINYVASGGGGNIPSPSFEGPSRVVNDGMSDATRVRVDKMDGGYTGN